MQLLTKKLAVDHPTSNPKLVEEQLDIAFDYIPISTSSSYLLVLLNCYALWAVSPSLHIGAWLLLATLISLYRLVIYTIRKKNPGTWAVRVWRYHNDSGSALTGILWGAGVLALVPAGSPVHIIIFVVGIAGLVSGSTSSLSLSQRAFLLFTISCLVPLSIRLYAMSDFYGWLLSGLCYIYMFFMWRICRQNGERALQNIQQASSLDRQKRRLLESEKLLDLHFMGCPLGLIEWDENFRMLRWNPAAYRIFGYSEEEIQTQKPDFFLVDRNDKGYFDNLHESRKSSSATIKVRKKDGSIVSCEWISTPLEDVNDKLVGYTSFITDISKRLEREELITHQAFYDAVTDLPNRRYFHERLREEMSRVNRSGDYSAVLFLDLDHFKDINDSLGHALGDELLQQFSRRLQQRLRHHEILARLGGDEFVVLLEELDHDLKKSQLMAAQVARMLLQLIQEPFSLENSPYTLTCSIGITLFNSSLSNEDEILKQADLALYNSKHRGRNCYSFFESEMSDTALRHIVLLNSVRGAIARGEFSLVYQPKVNISSNDFQGAETLLRWHNSELGTVSPAEFIPVLESSTLIIEVGNWVLENAFRQLHAWQSEGLWVATMRLAINISPRQLLDSDFFDSVTTMLAEHKVSPSMIEFEITENVLVEEVERVTGVLIKLANVGISFSIDDFGTGYSSLSYLKQLPISVLKIDKSFIDHCTEEGNDQAIVRSILGICSELGLTSVAEGVETEPQQKLLQAMGCDLLQGYLFSKPLSPQDFAIMMEKFN